MLPPQLSHWPNSGPRTATVSWLQSSPAPSVGKHPSQDPNKQLILGAKLSLLLLRPTSGIRKAGLLIHHCGVWLPS